MRCDQRAPTADFRSSGGAIASDAGRAGPRRHQARAVSATHDRPRGVAISQRAANSAPAPQNSSAEVTAGAWSSMEISKSSGVQNFCDPEKFPRTPRDARSRGFRFYFSGKQCSGGHIALRNAATAHCCECEKSRLYFRSPEKKVRDAVRAREKRLADIEGARERGRKAAEVYRARRIERCPCPVCGGRRRDFKADKCRKCWRAEKAVAKRALAEERARVRAQRQAERAAALAALAERSREKQRAQQKAWRLANPGYQKRWRKENPEKRRAYKRGRKIAKRSALVSDLSLKQRGRCAYCRIPLSEIHVDHIQPRARQGSNARRNLQLTCAACNMAKGAKDPIEFARETGRLL